MDYMINPVLMGGIIKETAADRIKVHIHGRLGVITISPQYISWDQPLKPGCDLSFYFSYLRVVDHVFVMDMTGMHQTPPFPTMLYGTITEINYTAIRVTILEDIGTVAVPLRFVFTDHPLMLGQSVEFYLSHMQVTRFRNIPVETI